MSTNVVGPEGAAPNYNLNDILNYTQSPKQPGGFRRVLGTVAGGVANVFMPGVGSLIGGLISGGGGIGPGVLGGETTQFLELQRQIQLESRAFETASMVLKSRHDAAMSVIRNSRSG